MRETKKESKRRDEREKKKHQARDRKQKKDVHTRATSCTWRGRFFARREREEQKER